MGVISEDEVEQTTLGWLGELGFEVKLGEVLSPGGDEQDREGYEEVILKERFLTVARRLNPKVPPDALERAFHLLSNPDEPDQVLANKAAYRMVVNGIKVDYAERGEQQSAIVRIVDFSDPSQNDWLAVNQFTIKGPVKTHRPDILIFLNGIPLGLFELKNPALENADVWSAFEQVQTYKSNIPRVFQYNAVCVISDYTNALLGSFTANKERYMRWRTIDGKTSDPLGPYAQLETLVKGVFQKDLFLKYLRHFILFEDEGQTVKKIAGYHQFHAVLAAVASVEQASQPSGTKKGGVVWHTQGAGKSIEMVCCSSAIMGSVSMANPTIVVVTDRNDLDGQLFETFCKNSDLLREMPLKAESREELRELLDKRPSGGIIFTTIQKFALADGETTFPALSKRHNVVVKCDEAHRSQYGLNARMADVKDKEGKVVDKRIVYGHAKNMRDALPNATFLAFTGTPISSEMKDTRAVFGDYIHIYDIADAVADGATVPVYYESRLVKLELKPEETPNLDAEFEEIAEDEEESVVEGQKRKWAAVEKLVGSESRIEKVAKDFLDHFDKRQETLQGKAMFVAMSRDIAVQLYSAIVKLRPDWHNTDPAKGRIKIVMTGSASDKQHLQPHIYSKDTKKLLEKRFKAPAEKLEKGQDELKVVIVRDMWLTGFDAPVVNTLYVDKPMKGHNLMQAIARANRVFKDKPGGLVVDYIGIANELKAALAEYTQSGGKNSPTVDVNEALVVLKDHMDLCRGILHGCNYSEFMKPGKALALLPAVVDHILSLTNEDKDKDGKRRFSNHLLAATKAFALCCTLDEAQTYRDELAFFQAVKSVLVKSNPNQSKTDEEKEHALRQLVSGALQSEGVVDIFKVAGLDKPDISILSDQFLEDVKHMKHKNLAVELLKRLLNDEIKSKFKTNIVQQKKFSDLLVASLNRYTARSIETAQVIEELIQMAKDFAKAAEKGQELGLNKDELAFYDALANDEASVRELGDVVLKEIAVELVVALRNSVSVDWVKRESVKAKIRNQVRKILKRKKYPPEQSENAIETVLKQAEALSAEWTA